MFIFVYKNFNQQLFCKPFSLISNKTFLSLGRFKSGVNDGDFEGKLNNNDVFTLQQISIGQEEILTIIKKKSVLLDNY